MESNPTVAGAIFAGLFSVIAILLQKSWESTKQREKEIREKKLPIYQEFMKQYSAFLINDPKITDAKKREIEQQKKIDTLVQYTARNTSEFITWGSDGFLKEFSTFKKIANSQEDNCGILMMMQVEKIFYEIRKDLGHKNRNLVQKDILRFFITDIDTFDKVPISTDENKEESNL